MPQSFLTVHNQALFSSLWLILDTSLCIVMLVVSFLCPLNNFPLCSIFRNPIVGAKNGGQKASPLELSTLHILIGTKNLNLGCHFLKQSWDPLTHPLSLEVAPHLPLLDSSRPNPNWCRHFLQSVGGPKKKRYCEACISHLNLPLNNQGPYIGRAYPVGVKPIKIERV